MADPVVKAPAGSQVWPRIFGLGLGLWLALLVTVYATGNPALVPSLILLGSFLVPVTFVVWAFERWRDEDLTTELLVTAFVVGGLLGTMGASVLEAYLLYPSALLYVGVGLIEEAAKLVALVLVTRRMTRRHTRDGVVLGAAVGFGFAAFESSGYAFQVLLSENGSLEAMVRTEVLRGVLAPLGHGLWTAILGGVLFARLARAHPRGGRPSWRDLLDRRLVLAYLGVALLHALWDWMPDLSTTAMFLLTGTTEQDRLLAAGHTPPTTAAQQELATMLQYGGLAVVSVAGLVALTVVWRRSRAEDRTPLPLADYDPLPPRGGRGFR